ncbi:glycerol-3-phosphate 1-O-acyltransferase PlsY [Bacillus sp. L381]|jgi:glycerol-3-phosphate acyltransferase PlsY|uniref:Glycerol-3-phosphate acyltransferase n=2 Tax=Bacillus amyloliquefaciens TaxID=1390 RepID=A0A9P1JHA4_BACAS|nr:MULTISPECIES: glycerol-3-phosphate 1-O-acyltransferase PlsY [Bacillus]AIW33804.1 glycerol-3-phosphate acyltransferase [Bacillus subtilis]AEB23782.1 putative glycerol-3-phosphate acyltransferase PlsY [Bacillus amyloliquefaciens TA208]AEB63519.1 glycerol-3-phosphate acyltransferase PlsY [Bacillus amyloliquefaciens LL3]AEK88778.1 putative glycerol-3-phosphate acyltransferase [Bacillus amyloliquefaciens XH7]ARW39149.1 Glycerol-3-phosphate 1-O-acyltransferase [Bacillus amyloliquefaciens]
MLIALLIILAYVLGSIPSGLVVGKLAKGIDIREHGSGNLGATNAFRTLGVKAGSVVVAADILKGTLAAALPYLLHVPIHPLLAGVAAVIGHVFPVFAKFKGGKAVATSGGVLLFYAPLLFVTMVAVFFVFLFLTKFVSLSSMLTGIYTIIYCLFVKDPYLLIVVTLLTAFVIYRHRANIKRIINKTEPKIKWF